MRGLLLVALLLISTGKVVAQATRVPLQVDLDQSVFAYDESNAMVEVYLAIEAAGLDYHQRGDAFYAELPFDVTVVRASDAELQDDELTPVWEDDSGIVFAVGDTASLDQGQYFVHQFRALVRPGAYEMRVRISEDESTGRPELELRREFLVPQFEDDEPSISDLTLASDLRPSTDRGNPFYKNGFVIRPNANRLYGQELSDLYFYVELYGTEIAADDDGRYRWYAFVSEANRNQPTHGLDQRSSRIARTPDVLAGSFDISTLPSGSYFLHVALLDPANEAMAETSRKFFVYNPDVERASTVFLEETFETSEYAEMPQDVVEEGLQHAALVANDQEKRRMRALSELDDKRRFLMAFWKNRDPVPATPQNEYQQAFMQRLSFVNNRFGTTYSDGWETDRGRVYVKYGQPAAIEPRLYDRDMLPHEIWQYDNIPGEGQAVFIFADRRSFGEFELIHSTVSGERSLADWQNELRRR